MSRCNPHNLPMCNCYTFRKIVKIILIPQNCLLIKDVLEMGMLRICDERAIDLKMDLNVTNLVARNIPQSATIIFT